MRPLRTALRILVGLCAVTACLSRGTAARSASLRPAPAEELANRLRARGLRVAYANALEQPFFAVPGSVYTVEGADLQIFVYSTESAASAEASRIDPSGRSVGMAAVGWIAPPHIFRSGPMIVIYLGSDAKIRGELTAALGSQIAGAE